MKFERLTYQVKDNIGFILLSSPPKNEMDTLFFQEFYDLVKEVKGQKELRGLIIQAAGRHFSSGANTQELLSLFRDTDDLQPEAIKKNSVSFRELAELPIPVVACLKGICFGSAMELALSAHFRIGASNTLLSFPETGFEIIPGLYGIYRLEKIVGRAQAMRFTLSGASISSEEALEFGLIDIFASKHDLENHAIDLINKIGANYRKELKTNYIRL
jgi:enoyl-CoA hydratase/carnithine racemase